MARPLNIEIIESIRKRVLSGEFDEQPFLPSERVLAEQLDTGRGIVRNALKALQQEGLLQLVPGRGATICRGELKPRLERFIVCLQDYGRLSNYAYEFIGLLSGICMAASDIYAEAIVSFARDEQLAENLISRYRKGDIQGALFIERFVDNNFIAELVRAGLPCVIANDEGGSEWIHSRMDFRQVGRTAGNCLTAAGHKRIGVVSGPLDRYIFREILAGFRGALAEEEIQLSPQWTVEAELHGGFEGVRAMLSGPDRPDAVFAMRDNRAEAIYQVCAELGLRIPEDLSVIGYDNITWPGSREAGLTTIEQPVNDIGRAAVELIEEWYLNGKAPRSRVLPCRLIERDSVKKVNGLAFFRRY
jgi:DNA-binding LacI/PurR family transcriptional regulator